MKQFFTVNQNHTASAASCAEAAFGCAFAQAAPSKATQMNAAANNVRIMMMGIALAVSIFLFVLRLADGLLLSVLLGIILLGIVLLGAVLLLPLHLNRLQRKHC